MKFSSQICTTKNQTDRLLTLGLKRETADMAYEYKPKHLADTDTDKDWVIVAHSPCGTDIPAWSFHRLIEMMPQWIDTTETSLKLTIDQGKLVCYRGISDEVQTFVFGHTSLYDSIIDTIEKLIKEGYFITEYLKD